MSELVINISWEYFFGIVGLLIIGAWYANGRFSTIETSLKWLKDNLDRIETRITNIEGKNVAYNSLSPLSLTEVGEKIINESGLKSFIDSNKEMLIKHCGDGQVFSTAYDIQNTAFECMDNYKFDDQTEKRMKETAYNNGISIDVVRRVAGIYFRDICLEYYKKDVKDIE